MKQQNAHPSADTNRPMKLHLSASAQVGRAFRCPPPLVAYARRGTESAPYLRNRVKAWGGKITLTGEDSPDTARKSVSLSLRGAQRRPVRHSLGDGGSNPASAAKRVLPVTGRNSAGGAFLPRFESGISFVRPRSGHKAPPTAQQRELFPRSPMDRHHPSPRLRMTGCPTASGSR